MLKSDSFIKSCLTLNAIFNQLVMLVRPQPDALKFARSCPSQPPLSRDGGASGQMSGLLRRQTKIKFTQMASSNSVLFTSTSAAAITGRWWCGNRKRGWRSRCSDESGYRRRRLVRPLAISSIVHWNVWPSLKRGSICKKKYISMRNNINVKQR